MPVQAPIMHTLRGGWITSCDSLPDYGVVWLPHGAACTKVGWSTFGQVLLSIHKKAYCWNSLVKRFQESQLTPFNLFAVAVLWSLNNLAVGKARLPTGLYRQSARCCSSRSAPTFLQAIAVL